MSGDSQNMERSTLERKDRAELAAVAGALGLKVPSRAKKADIVSLILDVIAEPGGSATGAASDPATDTAGSAAGLEASAPAGTTHDTAHDTPHETAHAHETARGTATDRAEAASEAGGETSVETSDAALHAARRAPGHGGRGDESGDDIGDDRSRGGSDTAQSTDPQSGERSDQSGEHGDGDGDGSAEGGGRNRRRRRRGRDRVEGEGGLPGQEFDGDPVEVSGLLDLREDGYGFLRVAGFLPSRDDVYVSVKQCRQLGLRKGDHLTGLARPAGHKEKNPALTRVETVNGMDPEQARSRPRFEHLTPVAPDGELTLDGGTGEGDRTGRIIDLIAPLARGQRGLVVAPPHSGRTAAVATIAKAIEHNHPDVQLIVLLIDERPEDVTALRRDLDGGEVVASTFDRPSDEHTAVAELTIEHAKRLVEYGHDVAIVLDGLTRLTRAYDATAPANGRTLAAGLDAGALHPPKRLFGAARRLEEGGSLTILATVLVDTGNAIDDLVFSEFEHTANQVLRLDGEAGREPGFALEVGASPERQSALLDAIAAGR